MQERNHDAALNLVREHYGDNNLKKRDVRPTKLVDFEGIARHHNVNIMLYEPKKNARSIWRLFYGKIQHKNDLPTIKMGLLGDHCFYIKKMDVLCGRWECKGCRQIFTRNEDLIRYLKEERCAGGKTKTICPGHKFRLSKFKFSYTACQWIEVQAIETGKHIHHKTCGHGGERMVKVWVLNDKGVKEPVSFLVDEYEPEINTVYQFHGCHWHGHTCLSGRTRRKQKRYKDTCKINWLIENNGCDTEYNLVSTWECEELIRKRVRFEKKFTRYPQFILYDFEAILVPLSRHPTDNLTYLSRHIPISVSVHDTLSGEREGACYLVDENSERLIERFIEVLTEKQEEIASDVLKQHPYPSDFQVLPDDVKKQCKQWVNQVPVIGFNSGKYDLNIVKEYFVKEISYNKDDKCNEDVFAAKKENDYMFLTTSRFKFLDIKNYIGPGLSYDAWCKSIGCRLQKLMFPYEWLDSYENQL